LGGGLNTYGYVKSNPLRISDPTGLLGNCGTPWGSCVAPKPQKVSVFGCMGAACVSSAINGSEPPQGSIEASLGGGIEICDPEKKGCKESQKPTVQPPGVPVPTQAGYIVGLSVKRDGRVCVRIGLFVSAPLPSLELGDEW